MGVHALLADNELFLRERVERLRAALPALLPPRVCAALIIGSVARGTARDDSDLDLLLVLDEGLPRRSDYTWWDKEIAPQLGIPETPFPVNPLFIGRPGLRTAEPNLSAALRDAVLLWDPGRVSAALGGSGP